MTAIPIPIPTSRAYCSIFGTASTGPINPDAGKTSFMAPIPSGAAPPAARTIFSGGAERSPISRFVYSIEEMVTQDPYLHIFLLLSN